MDGRGRADDSGTECERTAEDPRSRYAPQHRVEITQGRLAHQDCLAETIEPGHSAAVLVWENQWAAPFGAAVRKAGAQLVASGRIPTQAVIAAFEADAEATKEGA